MHVHFGGYVRMGYKMEQRLAFMRRRFKHTHTLTHKHAYNVTAFVLQYTASREKKSKLSTITIIISGAFIVTHSYIRNIRSNIAMVYQFVSQKDSSEPSTGDIQRLFSFNWIFNSKTKNNKYTIARGWAFVCVCLACVHKRDDREKKAVTI